MARRAVPAACYVCAAPAVGTRSQGIPVCSACNDWLERERYRRDPPKRAPVIAVDVVGDAIAWEPWHVPRPMPF